MLCCVHGRESGLGGEGGELRLALSLCQSDEAGLVAKMLMQFTSRQQQ